jgi:pantothenate kinase
VNSSGDKETKDIADLLTAVIQKQTNGLNYEQQDIEKVRDIIEDVLKQIQSKVDARLDINKPLSGNTVSV